MDRMTHRETPENTAYVDRGLVNLSWYSMTDEGYRGPAIERLAAYEDTEMEPERVAELAQAERDGRLVVLPCKVGDTVYRVFHPKGCKPAIGEHKVRTIGDAALLAGHIGEGFLVDNYLTRQEALAAVERLKGEGEHG